MQANLLIKDKALSDKIQKFKDEYYPHLTLTKLFLHALVELIKKEGNTE